MLTDSYISDLQNQCRVNDDEDLCPDCGLPWDECECPSAA